MDVADTAWIVAEMRARAADTDAGLGDALKKWSDASRHPSDLKKLLPMLALAKSLLFQAEIAREYALGQIRRCESLFAPPDPHGQGSQCTRCKGD